MKTFLKAVVFAVPGIIAIGLVVRGIYLIATPLLFGQPVETLATLGRHLTSLQAGLAVLLLGLIIALLSMAGASGPGVLDHADSLAQSEPRLWVLTAGGLISPATHDEVCRPRDHALDPVAVAIPFLDFERQILVRGHRVCPSLAEIPIRTKREHAVKL